MRAWRARSPRRPAQLLLDLQASGLFDGKALGKAGDRVANAFIMEALQEQPAGGCDAVGGGEG